MHMSDALVSTAVGITMTAVSTGITGYSVNKIKKTELSDNKIPMMGVMGAFTFAAQMINFTIPVTGSSGHIGGGILLAAILGPFPAFLTLTSVLIIQALFFADGGLLALGCNIFNIAFFSCLVAYPLIFRPILKKSMTPKRITIAAILSTVVALQLGAFGVVVETMASGVTELPFTVFLAWMQPIHLAIGTVEGVITGAVLCFIYQVRKEILTNAMDSGTSMRFSAKRFLIIMIVATVVVGGFFSIYASSRPDGLEWSIQKVIGDTEPDNTSKVHEKAQELQETTAILPDYSFAGEHAEAEAGTSVSGIVGAVITLLATVLLGALILLVKRIRIKASFENIK